MDTIVLSVKPSEVPNDRPAEVRRQVAYVLWMTLALNLLVSGLKIAYGYWTGLVAVYADGLHSLADGLSNIIGLVSIYLASRPPDEEHPYGHEKLEVVASAGVGLFLLATAASVTYEVYGRLTGDLKPPDPSGAVIAVMAGTFAVNLFVAWYERLRGRELQSPFLLSDSAHTASDLAVTLGVIGSIGLGYAGITWADPAVGLFVAGWIFWVGIRIIKTNADYLADRALLDPEKVHEAAAAVPGILGCSDIRSRGIPGKIFVDLSIQVAPALTIAEAHVLSHQVTDSIRDRCHGVRDVTVHVEPEGQ